MFRSNTKKRYKDIIKRAYRGKDKEVINIKDKGVTSFISNTIYHILRRGDIRAKDKLFYIGLDSIASI